MRKLSRRAGSLSESVTLAINAKAKAIMATGERVIRFGVGEPDFDTPLHIREAAAKALEGGQVAGYTPVPGTPRLRAAIAKAFTESGIPTEPTDVIASCGAKHSLFNALSVLLDDGDELIVPAPYWVSYPSMAQANGAETVIVDTRPEGCILTPERLRAALTPRSRVLLFVSPNNPTGVTHTREQIAAVGAVLRDYPDVTVVSDEIYEHLVYGDTKFVGFAEACPDLADRIVTVRGVSKSFAMTGWRIGYATGPREVISAMIRYQSHTTSNPTAIAQEASIAALSGPMDAVQKMRAAFDKRRKLMVELLSSIEGIVLYPPNGAFYCFPDISALLNERTGKTPLEFADGLLEKERVVTVPGEAFGAPSNLRLSYACSEEDIKEGMRRFRRYATA
ncbi:MAG: pyridoxal phosphate-dependent aminotransferase [Planctomycetota bacterium]|jgi:aspartate aminotransferase